MESPIKVNGSKVKDKVMVYKYGLMEANTKGNGKIIKLMEKELYIIQTEMSMKDNGSVIKHVDMEFTPIKMVPNM